MKSKDSVVTIENGVPDAGSMMNAWNDPVTPCRQAAIAESVESVESV